MFWGPPSHPLSPPLIPEHHSRGVRAHVWDLHFEPVMLSSFSLLFCLRASPKFRICIIPHAGAARSIRQFMLSIKQWGRGFSGGLTQHLSFWKWVPLRPCCGIKPNFHRDHNVHGTAFIHYCCQCSWLIFLCLLTLPLPPPYFLQSSPRKTTCI